MTNLDYENKRLLDVVDDNDNIVDSQPRTDVHRLGLLHREIHVWLFDKDKNVFFQKRGLHSASAGLLDATIGGHVNQGEEYIEAAVRETEEEIGKVISPKDLVLLKKFKKSHPTQDYLWGRLNNFFRSVYIYKYPVSEKDLKKEEGIPGGGFQKLSPELLRLPDTEYKKMFTHYILEEEISSVLKYLE
jgi:isopentenyldiphosphate isomerase